MEFISSQLHTLPLSKTLMLKSKRKRIKEEKRELAENHFNLHPSLNPKSLKKLPCMNKAQENKIKTLVKEYPVEDPEQPH